MLHVMKKMNEIRDEIERGPRYDYENYAGTAACTRILPSREDRRKRLHCENDKGAQGKDTPLLSLSLSLSLSRGLSRQRHGRKKEGKQLRGHFIFVDTRARETHCDGGTKGAQFRRRVFAQTAFNRFSIRGGVSLPCLDNTPTRSAFSFGG